MSMSLSNRRTITAVLHKVRFQHGVSNNTRQAIGYIEPDSKGRFADNSPVVTSQIIKESGNIIITKNSVYYCASYAKVQ